MKTVSIVIACYNEEGNVRLISERIAEVFRSKLCNYNYNIIFIDNDSSDATRMIIKQLCVESPQHISAIFNVHNFGSIRSSVYGLLQAKGDCVVKMSADLQDPPELLVDFVREWEDGYKIVIGVKSGSQENRIAYHFREIYYRIVKNITEINHIDNFVGYGLYDRQFMEIVRELNDPMPYFRGIVAELGYKYKAIEYKQPNRNSGKSKFNFARLYDYAMLGITSYSKVPLRLSIMAGSVVASICFFIGLIYLVYKIIHWNSFQVGEAPLLLGVFFVGAVQLISIGIIGEYISNINTRVLNRPLVIEEARFNLDNSYDEKGKMKINEAVNNECLEDKR